MIGCVDDDGVVELAQAVECVDNATDHVVDEGAVAIIAGSDFLEAFPTTGIACFFEVAVEAAHSLVYGKAISGHAVVIGIKASEERGSGR